LLVEWNTTERDYPRDTPLAELLEAQVECTPDSTAVVCGERRLTYRELNERSNQLSYELRKHGAGPDKLVAVCVDRSPEMVVALLAIVKAGAAYLPLDPLLPAERLRYMLEDSGVQLLVTELRICGNLPAFEGKTILLEDAAWQTNSCDNNAITVRPEHLAYVIYTSGSTGKPKGVEVLRGALTNLLWFMRELLQFNESDRLLCVLTISFDAAHFDIWFPLLVGAQMVLASRESACSGSALRDLLELHDITFMAATPVTWNLLFEAGWRGKTNLQAACGGEALTADLADKLMSSVKCVWNLYGPTESTITSTFHRVKLREKTIPIGRPVANTKCYILDQEGQPVPVGGIGELHIGGHGLARGYLNRPELTAEKFVEDPFLEAGARMYRTGDLAIYRADGNIECLGRIDHQVKIRGFRIELGEVETALMDLPGIKQAAVVAREDTQGDTQLAAYLVPSTAIAPAVSEIRSGLGHRLPNYMLPSVYVFLRQLPISLNGKIDRIALPLPIEELRDEGDSFVAPRTALERTLAGMWAEALGVKRMGIRDDFFEMGGHSLKAIRLFAKVLAVFPEFQPALALLLKAPTVEQFALTLQSGPTDWSPLVRLREGGNREPFFCVHGVGGNVLDMRELAMAMPPDQPFYCLQARGLDGHSEPFPSIEEAAECYIEEIQRVQPEGPYFLGGRSYGGIVAFEMARRLRAMGETVGILALIDSRNFAYGHFLSVPRLLYFNSLFFLRRTLHHIGALARMKPSHWSRYLLGHAKILFHLAGGIIRIARKIESAQLPMEFGATELSLFEGDLKTTLNRIQSANLSATRKFIPKPYDGHLLVFRASKHDDDPYQDEALGWRPVALGGITVYEVDGDHFSILRAPQVAQVAKELDRALREAQQALQECIQD
jgi:amino acid adenylation domain-containing protein